MELLLILIPIILGGLFGIFCVEQPTIQRGKESDDDMASLMVISAMYDNPPD